jgi:hypothetical protein
MPTHPQACLQWILVNCVSIEAAVSGCLRAALSLVTEPEVLSGCCRMRRSGSGQTMGGTLRIQTLKISRATSAPGWRWQCVAPSHWPWRPLLQPPWVARRWGQSQPGPCRAAGALLATGASNRTANVARSTRRGRSTVVTGSRRRRRAQVCWQDVLEVGNACDADSALF